MKQDFSNIPASALRASSVVELLGSNAREEPCRLAYIFLSDGEKEVETFTYQELDCRARTVAALIQSHKAAGERVLILYPPGIEYVAAFLGCLYAGAVAVLAYPPRLNRSLDRLQTIVADAEASIALTTTTILSRIKPLLKEAPHLKKLRWIATDGLADTLANDWQESAIRSDTLALLQYTSGSTGDPKGVMLSHRNLLHNSMLLAHAFEYNSSSWCVNWLPIYHDMGLIGGVLQPLYGRFPCTLMSPASFLQSPVRWLQAITRFKATISGAPNFAYELCLRKIKPEQLSTLDLSSWNVAFNGAEPIRRDTMERFTVAFASCGFRRDAFYPCYGLAEATLMVSGSRKATAQVVKTITAGEPQDNKLAEAVDNGNAQPAVSSGHELHGQRIAIVSPETLLRCSPGEVGEIWVAGPSVAQGYWNRPEETRDTFRAYVRDTSDGPFLRTGDLGYLKNGELFVTGRLKDLIIIRGRNFYPQDIEQTVERCDTVLEVGGGAAFSVDTGEREQLVIVHEVNHRRRPDLATLIGTIRQAVVDEHEIQPSVVVLIRTGSIPKTSSGKIRRRACREMFLEKTLKVLAEWHESPVSQNAILETTEVVPVETTDQLESWLAARFAASLGMDASEIDVNRPVTQFGVDSLTAVELTHNIETSFGTSLPMADLLHGSTIAQLATKILAQQATNLPGANDGSMLVKELGVEHPLSYGQQAMWFLHKLNPESPIHNLANAICVHADLNIPALHRAFTLLAHRHPSLRTVFSARDGKPYAHVEGWGEVCFQQENATDWSEARLNEQLREEAHRPFNLEQGPLMRVNLFSYSRRKHVLMLVVHHIVADFWSLAIMLQELGELYRAESSGASASLPPLPLQYADYANWQMEMLSSERGEQLWEYWQKQLSGELPELNLPTDRPRPPVQTHQGATYPFKLSKKLTRQLKALSQAHETTLYTTLLTAFNVLLHRYTGQEDILVGSLAVGRERANWAGVVGYFVNPIVLRADTSGNPTFQEFLGRMRRTTLDALAHHDYPFPLLVKRLQPTRDPSRSPLFQSMFVLQKTYRSNEVSLASLALGEAGAEMKLAGLPAESLAIEQRLAQFDVTLLMAEINGALRATFEYNTDLFDETTIARMADHLETLLLGIVADAQLRLSDLPLLTAAEQRHLIQDLNDTKAYYPDNFCIHELFEAQVAQTPDKIAVVFGDRELTYAEVNTKANQLAHYLRGLGVGPESRVGICIKRSLEMVVGLLGILKAGGAYLPVDPAYPAERLSFIVEDGEVEVLLTDNHLRESLPTLKAKIISLSDWEDFSRMSEEDPNSGTVPSNAAYVIYTSGSTGQPKGVVIEHRNVVNFFAGMNERIGCDVTDTLLAVTNISFDISVLELLWTLTRGCRAVIIPESPLRSASFKPKLQKHDKGIQFSLFYFASNDDKTREVNKYRLLREGAKFADQNDFTAVWTPERHFHAFGGLYPNPSVTSAALAAMTERINIRAGSVVLPLHDPIRVAEEWSLVDNLSNGRVGIAFASGWHADDFVFFPDRYADRKEGMFRSIETVRNLWRGEVIKVCGGASNEVEIKIYPQPVQPELPVWITAAGDAETFFRAGQIGAHVLTHLLGQTLEDVADKIKIYRDSLAAHGHNPTAGRVTLMLHTFIGKDKKTVRESVKEPFTNYLRTSLGLIANLIRSLNLPLDLKRMSAKDMDDLLVFAFDRYFETSALFGTVETCARMVDRLKASGVDEIGCLIDFGVDADSVLASLRYLNELRIRSNTPEEIGDNLLLAQATRHGASMLQCTPSMLRMLTLDSPDLEALKSLRVLMLGGEALSPALAKQVQSTLTGKLINMYGPTETTVWSATHEVDGVESTGAVPIGKPIANTQIYILDQHQQLVPAGVSGELHIGGAGLARGYLKRPELTAENFIPNSFSEEAGGRLYRTGDIARYLQDGTIEFLGRRNHQIKLRGFRIELGEIEAVLGDYPNIREVVVLVREDAPEDHRLVAYIVANEKPAPSAQQLRDYVLTKLPEYMVPAAFVMLDALPLTPNGKVNRKALLAMEGPGTETTATYVAPQSKVEQTIAAVWRMALKIEKVSIHDNFFDLGGHSLLMAQVQGQLRQQLERDIPLIKLLEHPTISSLARYLDQEQNGQRVLEQSQDRAIKQRALLSRHKESAMRMRSLA